MESRVVPVSKEGKIVNYLFRDQGLTTPDELNSQYAFNSRGVIFLYSCTDYSSFQSITSWIKSFLRYLDRKERTVMVMVGTKCELVQNKKVSTEEARSVAEAYGLKLFEVSIRDNINSKELLEYLKQKIECVSKNKNPKSRK